MSAHEYSVYLDNGVRLTISLPDSQNGPSIQSSYFPGSPWYRVQLPGGIVRIYAPAVTVGGVNWNNVAKCLGAEFDFPIPEPPPPKPKRDPYVQKVIE